MLEWQASLPYNAADHPYHVYENTVMATQPKNAQKMRRYFFRCRALLAPQPGSKGCDLPACPMASGNQHFSHARARDPGFLENAFPSDNDILEFITKTSPAWAENRLIETARPTNLAAELSAARNSVIHAPLSHPLSPGLQLYRLPGQPHGLGRPMIMRPPMLMRFPHPGPPFTG